MEKKSVILYHSEVQKYGGIERFNELFLKNLSQYYNLTFVYYRCSKEQLEKYQQYVNCVQFTNQRFTADMVISASAWGRNIFDNVECPVLVQMIHADLQSYALSGIFRLVPDKRITHFVSVSKRAADSLKSLHNLDSTIIYNLQK